MSGYLLDTNVISEIARPVRDTRVVAFLDALDDGYISVITIHELYFGLERLQHGRRRAALTEAIEHFVATFRDRLIDVGEPAARAAASLRAAATGKGRVLHLADSLIAATALVNGLTVATRNVSDFEGLGVGLYDPWNVPGPG